ncbi:MAG TPA: S9 family peptidase [Candidatus Nitrosotalea sp.]|nr:S9 family peptidase [Candidatus Nitrosotalea sp.]
MSERDITPQDLGRFRWVDQVRLSPDAGRLLFTVSRADLEARENRSAVMLMDPQQGTSHEVGEGVRSHQPAWAPDELRFAFLARRENRDQIMVAELQGSGRRELRQLTQMPDGCSSFAWSPDGRSLGFTAPVAANPEAVVEDPRSPDGDERARRPPVARLIRRLDDKHDGSGFVDGRYHHLFVVPAAGGPERQLTFGAWNVEGFDWSPDSSELVVCGDAEPDGDLRRTRQLYLVPAQGGDLTPIVGGLEMSHPAWSPGGAEIAFIAPTGPGAGLFDRVWVVERTGGEPRCLTPVLDRAVGGGVGTDMRGGHGVRLCWDDAGERIWFVASAEGVAEVMSVGLEGEPRVERAAERNAVYDFDLRGRRLATCVIDALRPGEVYLAESGSERRLTDLNPWLLECRLSEPEAHVFQAADGVAIEGWLMPPTGPRAAERPAPLVMEIHGGPHGQYGWAFFHEFQILAAKGFWVFYVNPRGSEGYGEQFCRAVVGDWAGEDFLDLMTALDQLLEQNPGVDRERLGVAGGSYGGYLTNWAIGHTDRFRAAVAMRSISNLVSEYAQHDIVLWGRLELGEPPWPDADELWRRSPIRYAKDINTPLLLVHSEMDLRCAISQAEEMFGALRLLGREVEMVRFPGESHDLSRSGRPDRRVERLSRIAEFLVRHLLPEGTAGAGE